MCKVISIINHKGGIGKTTVAFNLAHGLALKGKHVLAIDSDSQGSLSQCFGYIGESLGYSLYDFYQARELKVNSINEFVDLISSDLSLEDAKYKLSAKPINRELVLKDLIDHYRLKEQYDYIIIDCPPSLDILTINAMVASDGLIIPVKPELLPYNAIGSLNEMIEGLQKVLNPHLKIVGVLYNNVEQNRTLTAEIIDRVNQLFGDLVFQAKVGHYVSFAESPIYNKSVFEYAKGEKGTNQFAQFVNEFLERTNKK